MIKYVKKKLESVYPIQAGGKKSKNEKYTDRNDLHYLINIVPINFENELKITSEHPVGMTDEKIDINTVGVLRQTSGLEINSDLEMLSPIDMSTKSINEILGTKNFKKRYCVFLKILYCSLLLDVNIFKTYREQEVFMNLYDMKHSFLKAKRKILVNLSTELLNGTRTYKDLHDVKHNEYTQLFTCISPQLKTIDKIVSLLDKLIEHKIIHETDTIMSLVMPYFYKYDKYIETYAMF